MANPPSDQAPVRQQASMPRDGDSYPMQLTPGTVALKATYNTSISSNLAVTLQVASTTTGLPATSLIEVNAITGGIFLKWTSTASAATDGFDEYIQAGTTRHYRVPTGVLIANFISATGTLALIEK